MSLTTWWRRLWLFLGRDRATRELEEEMQLHRELRARALEQAGLDAGAAQAEAAARFGHRLSLTERSRDTWGIEAPEQLWWDVRYALRRLRQRPGYTAAIVLVLGLGIGATTAMFSAVDAVMLRPLPFEAPDRLVELRSVRMPFDPGPGREVTALPTVDITTVSAMPELFASVGAFASGRLNLPDPDRPLRLRVGVVTAAFFRTLGVGAAAGRTFADEEGIPGGNRVVILSDALWRRQYGGRDLVGQAIRMGDDAYQVMGVMPAGFSFPEESDLWIPMTVPNTFETFAAFRGFLSSRVVARLTPGVSPAVAGGRLLDRWEEVVGSGQVEGRRQSDDRVLADLREGGALAPLQQSLSGNRRTALLVLLGATGLLLLIACANVTHLLLSDSATRTREVALRTALGATRGRIFRQVLTESVILGLGGVLAGLVLAPLALSTLTAILPAGLSGVAPPRIDFRVLGFAAGLGLLTGIGFGLWPARIAIRTDPAETLKSGGGPTATGNRAGGRRLLVVAELALTVLLLVGAGLLLRSFSHLMGLDRGMDTDRVGSLELSFARGQPRPVLLGRIEGILTNLRNSPLVDQAAAINDLPLGGAGGISIRVEPVGGEGPPPERRFARYLQVSPGYFGTLGIAFRSGRDFGPGDDSLAPPRVIISESMARDWFPGVEAVGRQLHAPGEKEAATVIGVVADVRELSLDQDPLPQLYLPITRATPGTVALVARGRGPDAPLLAALRGAVRAVDPAQAVDRVRMMEEVVRQSVAPRRTNAMLISLFAGLALVLAALGVYAVVAHGMAQRGREFGIRTALGATAADLLRMVSREIFVVVTVGVGLGLAAAWGAARVVQSLVYGVTVHDPLTFAVGPVALMVIAMAAALHPIRRVYRVNPTAVMRVE